MTNTTQYTPEQIEKAKEFLWNNLETPSRDMILHITCTNELLEKYSEELKGINLKRQILIGYSFK
jgi:hypothetical protein